MLITLQQCPSKMWKWQRVMQIPLCKLCESCPPAVSWKGRGRSCHIVMAWWIKHCNNLLIVFCWTGEEHHRAAGLQLLGDLFHDSDTSQLRTSLSWLSQWTQRFAILSDEYMCPGVCKIVSLVSPEGQIDWLYLCIPFVAIGFIAARELLLLLLRWRVRGRNWKILWKKYIWLMPALFFLFKITCSQTTGDFTYIFPFSYSFLRRNGWSISLLFVQAAGVGAYETPSIFCEELTYSLVQGAQLCHNWPTPGLCSGCPNNNHHTNARNLESSRSWSLVLFSRFPALQSSFISHLPSPASFSPGFVTYSNHQ